METALQVVPAEAIELAGGRTMVSQLGAPGVRIETID